IGQIRRTDTEEAARDTGLMADATEPVEVSDELLSVRRVVYPQLVEAGAKELRMQQLVVIPGPLRQLVGFGKPSLRFVKRGAGVDAQTRHMDEAVGALDVVVQSPEQIRGQGDRPESVARHVVLAHTKNLERESPVPLIAKAIEPGGGFPEVRYRGLGRARVPQRPAE